MTLTTGRTATAHAAAVEAETQGEHAEQEETTWERRLGRIEPFLVAAIVATGLVLRFATTSALWLDEALSVNIASLPIGEIPEALRQDGHPPLYYVALHAWMEVFGDGDVAVRALSGLISVATLPLAWLAGRRLGGRTTATAVLVLTAASPFAFRYATEARMYALVMLVVFAGYLAVGRALERSSIGRLAVVAGLAAALLYTHYWGLWLLLAVGALSLVSAWRASRRHDVERRRTALRLAAALVAGGIAFLPWVGVLLYQSANTGTPWAAPVRPTALVAMTVADFGGGPDPEALLAGIGLVVLVGLALLARPIDRSRLEIDVRTVPGARPEAAVLGGTIVIGLLAGYAGNSTYATRYGAAFFPLVMLLGGFGASRFRSRIPRLAALGSVVALGLVVGVLDVTAQRTQAEEVATVIEDDGAPGDVVVYCPDQLGPAASRALDGDFDQVTYPALDAPERIDWRDYAERNDAADPEAIAERVLERAGPDQSVWVVFQPNYRTLEDQCEDLVNALIRARGGNSVVDSSGRYFEASNLFRMPAPG